MAASNNLYERIIGVTETYLGPASERFINRQIANHLHKEPDALHEGDLASLVQWIKVTISVLTEDADMVERYINELEGLTPKGGRS